MMRRARSLVLLVLLTSCAAVVRAGQPAADPQGFLGDYSRFQRLDPDDDRVLVERVPRVDWSRYGSLHVAPVEVAPLRPDDPRVGAGEWESLAAHFEGALRDALERSYPLVDAPRARGLVLRAAVTDVRPGNPVANVLSTLALRTPLSRGGAAMEAEVVDAETGRRLAAIVAVRRASLVPGIRFSAFKRWGQAKGILDDWASRFRDFFDRVRFDGDVDALRRSRREQARRDR